MIDSYGKEGNKISINLKKSILPVLRSFPVIQGISGVQFASLSFNFTTEWFVLSKFCSEPFPVRLLGNPIIRIFLKIRHLLTVDLLEKWVNFPKLFCLVIRYKDITLVDTRALFWIIKPNQKNNNFCISAVDIRYTECSVSVLFFIDRLQ